MEDIVKDIQVAEKLGQAWIDAIITKDFNHLATICQPDINSTLVVPRRTYSYENISDLITRVEDWYSEYSSIEIEQERIAMVGEKLGIFYRLICREMLASYTIEQQIYCTLRDGRIDHLKLLCSGFQPDQVMTDAPGTGVVDSQTNFTPSTAQPVPQADALLEFKAKGEQGSTCALLTPYIKQKLGGMSSGQVLEVRVDDIDAKEDIEAWSRLSGNSLLKMEQRDGQDLVFFISKK